MGGWRQGSFRTRAEGSQALRFRVLRAGPISWGAASAAAPFCWVADERCAEPTECLKEEGGVASSCALGEVRVVARRQKTGAPQLASPSTLRALWEEEEERGPAGPEVKRQGGRGRLKCIFGREQGEGRGGERRRRIARRGRFGGSQRDLQKKKRQRRDNPAGGGRAAAAPAARRGRRNRAGEKRRCRRAAWHAHTHTSWGLAPLSPGGGGCKNTKAPARGAGRARCAFRASVR